MWLGCMAIESTTLGVYQLGCRKDFALLQGGTAAQSITCWCRAGIQLSAPCSVQHLTPWPVNALWRLKPDIWRHMQLVPPPKAVIRVFRGGVLVGCLGRTKVPSTLLS